MLSTTSEHALRALMHLAALPEGESMLGKELSQLAGVPPNYLSKILLTLGNAGILEASRGTGGGYPLARKPGKIRLIEVVDLFDKTRARPACLLGLGKECSDDTACSAHSRWKSVRRKYVQFLERTSIAQIEAWEVSRLAAPSGAPLDLDTPRGSPPENAPRCRAANSSGNRSRS